MALSQIDLVNAALLLIGAKKISSLTDATKAARLASSLYELARNEIFDLPIDWKFATTRAELSAYATDPLFGYDYQYELPAGCRRVVAMVDEEGDEVEYEWRTEVVVTGAGVGQKERNMLLTNQSEAFIKYIVIRTNLSRWPGWFTKLVYVNLAILLCEPLKQDKQKKNQLLIMYEEAYKKAEAANGMSDVDVSSDNIRFDRGNTEVVDAARSEQANKRYIKVETS